MDYEKKYKEALERAKDMLKYKEVRQEDMEYLFPELKEDEDERIRKVLKGVVNEYYNVGYADYVMDIPKADIIAWLEKQGEQKPAEWSEEDEAHLQGVLKYLWDDDLDDGICEYDHVSWLKHLKDRVQPQKEWDEEDEETRDEIIGVIWKYINTPHSFIRDDEGNFESTQRLIDWLKSLRPQKHWKPSEEQMKALRYVFQNYTPNVTNKIAWDSIKTLELMYHELKKL